MFQNFLIFSGITKDPNNSTILLYGGLQIHMFFPVRDNHQGRGHKKVGKKGCGNCNACQESEIAKPSFQPVSEFLLTGKWRTLFQWKNMRPLKNTTFCLISALGPNFNPQNTQCIPVVKIFARLELRQNSAFFKGLNIVE